jgi:UDP-glucose 4-epimerase
MTQIMLVTGGAGFIGSRLCERLVADGNRVIVLDNFSTSQGAAHKVPGVEYRTGHTKDVEALVPESVDRIYHLGEYARPEKSFEDVAMVWDLNVVGTFGVLEYWRKRGCKLVYAGSSTKFADGGLGRDQSPYAWTKAANTELVRNYGTWFSLPYAITYFYNVYGPGERAGSYGTLIEIFRQKYLKKEPLAIVSPGTQRRNFTHVDDIVDGLVCVGEKGEGDDFGLGNEQDFSILEIAHMFGTPTVMLPERQGNRMTSVIDTSKARAIGWSAQKNIADYITAITNA